MSKKIYGIPVSTPLNPAKVSPDVPAEKIASSVAAYMKANPITPSGIGARPDDWMPTAEEVGARPNTWTPTAEDVGARPNTWTPSASDVGAVPTSRTVNSKALSGDITLSASDVGAAPSSHNHSASNITSGTLGVARGGTGKATHTSNAVLTGNGTNAVNNVATSSGALYATAANGAAKFGTLPVAQGGTGATTSASALANLGGISIKKLWENASPTSAFAAQTVSLDLSGYDYVIIDAVANVQNWIITQSFVFARNKDANILIPSTGSLHSRDIHTKNNGIQFDGGNSGQSAINQSCVPIRICGIKGVG